jgi:two-component system sensor histidine kinase KdpD
MSTGRRDPDVLLSQLKEEELKQKRGRLKVFFGAVAGVGKTYAMLEAAQKLRSQNVDVIAGYVETHGRAETEALLEGLEILPSKYLDYKNTKLRELDVDAAIVRKPEVILVDELAHTNAPGSRHAKRWQDVQELLEAGIDVFSTINVQHIESLHDVVAQITRVSIQERVPDFLLEKPTEIELVDLPPDELLERLKEGKVYLSDQVQSAMENFFRKGNLIALRELALRYTAERVVAQMNEYRQLHEIKAPWPASEYLLVCISPSPLAARLVRAGKRMADALHAKWLVLYVEGPGQTSSPIVDKERAIDTLRLAEQLGAQTLELSAGSVAEEIVKCANQYNVSKIIIGKPARPRWKEILFGSVVDDVIRRSGAVDVYVITGDDAKLVSRGNTNLRHTSKVTSYMRALGVVAASTVLAKFMMPYFELANVVMVYLLGVVIVATRYGRGPSILASILSVAAFDFVFVPPFYTFAVSDTQYLITFTVMLIVALVISTMTVRIKQQAETSRLREKRTAVLYSMSRDLSSTLDMDNLIGIGLKHTSEVFNSKVAIFLSDEDGRLKLSATGEGKYHLDESDQAVAVWVYKNRQPAGLSTNTLPGAKSLYIPLLGAKKTIGVLAISPEQADRFGSPEQLKLLETFCNQLALACERAQLAYENEQTRLRMKTEQLRNSLLSSVSHDLRTPLATITGAASSIMVGAQSMTVQNCKEMAKEIYQESIRLNRLVGNLLDMTKLQSGTLQVSKELCPVEELVGAALSYLDDRLSDYVLKTSLPESLPPVSIDTVLIQQVLINLLENIIKHAPDSKEIDISAAVNDKMVTMAVSDRGPGIPAHSLKRIFEKFYREKPSDSTGAGLGLAICSGIIEAHGGTIWVEERAGGGSVFKFTLPAAEAPPDLEDEPESELK